MINKELKEYIENNIFPEYSKNDEGHNLDHIKYVIERSLKFAKTVQDINIDMVYTIAAYHDIGHHIDKKTHEKISSEMLLKDDMLKQFFSKEEIKIMADAVYDHRASMKGKPRTIYGEIVSSADRNVVITSPLKRTYSYRKKENPNAPLDEIIEESRQHLIEKFGSEGYATEKMYFDDPDYQHFLEDIKNLTNDKEKFREAYLLANNLQQENIKKGDIYRHFKGKMYQILDVVYDSETNNDDEPKKVVVYQALYGEKLKWARPYEMFISEVDHQKYPDVKQQYRFEKITDDTTTQIVLCSSKKFATKTFEIAKTLKELGFNPIIPQGFLEEMEKNSASRLHFSKIIDDRTDCLLIINENKNGVDNYIEANVFAEIAFGFYYNKPIYLLNDIYPPYEEELIGWNTIPLKGDLTKIKKLTKKPSKQ